MTDYTIYRTAGSQPVCVYREADRTSIPFDIKNMDYYDFLNKMGEVDDNQQPLITVGHAKVFEQAAAKDMITDYAEFAAVVAPEIAQAAEEVVDQ